MIDTSQPYSRASLDSLYRLWRPVIVVEVVLFTATLLWSLTMLVPSLHRFVCDQTAANPQHVVVMAGVTLKLASADQLEVRTNIWPDSPSGAYDAVLGPQSRPDVNRPLRPGTRTVLLAWHPTEQALYLFDFLDALPPPETAAMAHRDRRLMTLRFSSSASFVHRVEFGHGPARNVANVESYLRRILALNPSFASRPVDAVVRQFHELVAHHQASLGLAFNERSGCQIAWYGLVAFAVTLVGFRIGVAVVWTGRANRARLVIDTALTRLSFWAVVSVPNPFEPLLHYHELLEKRLTELGRQQRIAERTVEAWVKLEARLTATLNQIDCVLDGAPLPTELGTDYQVAVATDLALTDRLAAAERVLAALTRPYPVDYLVRLRYKVAEIDPQSIQPPDRTKFLELLEKAKAEGRVAKQTHLLHQALALANQVLE